MSQVIVRQPSRLEWGVGIALASTLVAGLVVLYRIDPAGGGVYPVCLLHYLTGLNCPGCGTLRAVHQLLHGHLSAALAMNPLTVCLLPILIGSGISSLAARYFQTAPLPRLPARWGWVTLGVLVAFGILRNVPIYPFTLLAPH